MPGRPCRENRTDRTLGKTVAVPGPARLRCRFMREDVLSDSIAVIAHAAAIVARTPPGPIAIASAGIVRDVVAAAAVALTGRQIWFADDRCLTPGHPDSAADMIERLAPGADIRRIAFADEAGDAARLYDESLRAELGEDPAFELVIAAAGGDGRIAGLFPDGPELAERSRLAVASGRDHDGPRRVGLTLPVLNRARRTLVLATGADKAPMVARVRDGELLPAARILGAEWILDRAAATAPVREPRRRAGEPLEGQEVLFEL